MKTKSCLFAIIVLFNALLSANSLILKSSIFLSKYQNNLSDISISFHYVPSFQIGPTTELLIFKNISTSLGLLYTFNGSGVQIKLDSSNNVFGKYITQFVCIPLTFNYFLNNKKVFFLVGPEININVKNKIKMENGEIININGNSNKIVFAFNIGIGILIKKIKYPISIELILNQGFSSTLQKDQSALFQQEIKLNIGLGIINSKKH